MKTQQQYIHTDLFESKELGEKNVEIWVPVLTIW